MSPRLRIGLAIVALLGGFVFFLLTVGSLGDPQPDVERIGVDRILALESPADVYGDRELRISGFFAELDADCEEPADLAPSGEAAWLGRTCPLRVLVPYQPAESVSQAELAANGLRLAAPIGQPFPARARPGGPNLRLQQLVFVGHFDDPASAGCAPASRERCRNTFVVSDYDGLLR